MKYQKGNVKKEKNLLKFPPQKNTWEKKSDQGGKRFIC